MKWFLLLLPLFFFHAGCEQHHKAELVLVDHAEAGAAEHAAPPVAPQTEEPKTAPDSPGPKFFRH